ncbi:PLASMODESMATA CALLOSE-BINDING PROTEIN 2-like [Typha latifolia]|uniref:PLASMODESMATA CALLOSE-BINDING PROTEIN 2-like n=1 Tax=Typha latifolia TaxID=4733 RepID=UPI003C2D7158
MAALLYVVLMLAMLDGSDAAWCVCRSDQSDTALQKTLDYACGAGADCSPLLQNGACYNPNTVKAHCSYAANSYYQRKGRVQGSCDFGGTATATSTDPSSGGCTYPATSSPAGTSTPTTTNTPGSTTPSTFSPPTGTFLGGLSPSGSSITDNSDGGFLPEAEMVLHLFIVLFSLMAFLRG